MAIPPPPDWLEEWEAESLASTSRQHPEWRPDEPRPLNCPQCRHAYHSTQELSFISDCGCPGCYYRRPKT